MSNLIRLRSGVRKGEWWEIRLPSSFLKDANLLDQLLVEQFQIPTLWVKKLEKEGGIQAVGDRLRLRLFGQWEDKDPFPPDWVELSVLYEDDFCLVINKPAGMPVHPSNPDQTGTLANAVAGHYVVTGQNIPVRHIHRLDEDTTGAILYAKNEYAQSIFDEAMRQKEIDRRYAAIVYGRPTKKKGIIDAPIGRDRHHSGRRRVSTTGKPAVTHYEVIEYLANTTLLRLRLETGRTHQVRVHLSSIGHPIVGDPLYSHTHPSSKETLLHRQALHGESLIFEHPLLKEKMMIEAPWPEDMQAVLEHLKKNKI